MNSSIKQLRLLWNQLLLSKTEWHAFGQGNLSKPVLSNINLNIYSGEIIILTRPSGSGKTTLLSLIGGLRSVQCGSLKIFGEEMRGASKKQLTQIRNQIGFIFQHHNLLKCLTAYSNVSQTSSRNSYIRTPEGVRLQF